MGERVVCSGCGAVIQTADKGAAGYAPPAALEREHVICQRCFRLKHYNEIEGVDMTDDDFLKIIHEIGSRKALIVKVVDIFDFDGSWLNGLPRFAGGNPVLLVGNKVDLLPKLVNRNKILKWMRRRAKEFGMKPVDAVLMSAVSGEGVEETAGLIDAYRKNRDVYIVGCTNTGKSTFVNKLIQQFGEEGTPMITTSNIPGTTLNMIDLPLDDQTALYDTPGIVNRQQMAHLLNTKELKVITPQKEIKQRVYQLQAEQTLFFGGLGRMDFLEGEAQSFIVYMSNELPIHRTKLEKADLLYDQHLGGMLSPPEEEHAASFPPMQEKEWKVPAGKYDMVFSGLGWITISGDGAVVRTYIPEGAEVTIRESIF
ncbi:ribosome biogenesis GTPase YqeH [Alkalicoccus chagannorensis]|uniref:ribosome biogenesis GTPase YqeH n=1 Tax=Alkalicoccus chagannorensis TaxID=427072 RepID=UPI00041CFAE1|nr:ribosome biogenesis GTPase YqeH [Alkalicoccus chagannorensis]